MDFLSKEKRSKVMASIKGKGNKSTEIKLLAILKTNRFTGWRRHYNIDGTPDFAWPILKIALFVDGCFWHGCPYCRRPPKSNVEFWEGKVRYNLVRDRKVSKILRNKGWKVIRIRECKIDTPGTLSRIKQLLLK